MENILLEIDSIPVMLDGIKRYDNCDMSRCSYITIESDLTVDSHDFSSNWLLVVQALNVPFCLRGLSGIIWKPLGNGYTFDSPESVKELFDAIEDNPLLYADTSDVWLPSQIFGNSPQERGCIYRIQKKLFGAAYSYQKGRISCEQFLEFCEESKSGIAFSEIETRAFSAWRNMPSEQYGVNILKFHSRQQHL